MGDKCNSSLQIASIFLVENFCIRLKIQNFQNCLFKARIFFRSKVIRISKKKITSTFYWVLQEYNVNFHQESGVT